MTTRSNVQRQSALPSENMLAAALDYARRGIPVFPCKRATKAPLTRRGFNDATTDKQKIREWWGQWPHAMIGIATGRTSGIDVLDLDLKPDEYIDGRQEMPDWQTLSCADRRHSGLTSVPTTRPT
jgi:hypothetical protein